MTAKRQIYGQWNGYLARWPFSKAIFSVPASAITYDSELQALFIAALLIIRAVRDASPRVAALFAFTV